jgi:hypothetical protein
MMRRVTMLLLVVGVVMAAALSGAEARPRGPFGAVLGIITNPIGAFVGAARRATRHTTPRHRSSRHRSSKPAAAAAAATGAAAASAAAATSQPDDMAPLQAAVADDDRFTPMRPRPKPPGGDISDAKATQVSAKEPDVVSDRRSDAAAPPAEARNAAERKRQLGLVGPAAWPSAFEDVIGYALWPRDYAERLRAHGIGDVLATAFTPSAALLAKAQDKAKQDKSKAERTAGDGRVCASTAATPDTDWPAAAIARAVELDDSQRSALDALEAAVRNGAAAVRASCRDAAAPVGRLRTLQAMLWAVHDAAQAVRAPLAKFYNSLTDEQKQQFAAPAQDGARSSGRSDLMQICARSHELPKQRVEKSLHATRPQRASLDALQKKSFEMGQFLMASCMKPMAATPPERLDAAADRLTAVIFAASNVNIALNEFTRQLDGEQKTKLETIGR